MNKIMKPLGKKGETKAKKKAQDKRMILEVTTLEKASDACVEVVADIWEVVLENSDDLSLEDLEKIIMERGVSKDFLQEVLDSRKIEKEKDKTQALAGLKAAYKKLPKHLKEILDNMDSDELCDAICGVED